MTAEKLNEDRHCCLPALREKHVFHESEIIVFMLGPSFHEIRRQAIIRVEIMWALNMHVCVLKIQCLNRTCTNELEVLMILAD